MNGLGINLDKLATLASSDFLSQEVAFFVNRVVRLRNEEFFLLIRSDIFNLIADFTVLNQTIRSLNKSKLINTSVGAKRVDQTNVGTLRSLNRADTTVVRSVHVAHFKASTVTVQTTRSECREAALVSQFCQRVSLVHELRQLRTTKEVTNNGTEGLRVDELLWRHALQVHIKESHTLFNETLCAGKSDTALVAE